MKKVYEPIKYVHAKSLNKRLLVPIKNKLHIYNDSYMKESVLVTEDDILNFHPISMDRIVILAKSNKTVSQYDPKGQIINSFTYAKKMTGSFTITENNEDYLFLSDKVGNTSLQLLNNPSEVPRVVLGHADPIEFLAVSPSYNKMLTADSFGKIKICEFPNVFNVISVLFYKNEDIKFCDFLNANQMIVLDSDNELHLWDLNLYEIKEKLNIRQLTSLDDLIVVSVFLFAKKFIYLDCKQFYLIVEVNSDNKFNLIHREEKENKEALYFPLYEDKLVILVVNEEGEIINKLIRDI